MGAEENKETKKAREEDKGVEEPSESPGEAEKAEEAKEEKPAPEKKTEEEEVVEERIYTVPLGRARIVPRKKHSPKAIRMLRGFIERHMKAEEDSVRISNEVNEKIWGRGIEKPPRKIRVRVTKDAEGVVTVHLAEGD